MSSSTGSSGSGRTSRCCGRRRCATEVADAADRRGRGSVPQSAPFPAALRRRPARARAAASPRCTPAGRGDRDAGCEVGRATSYGALSPPHGRSTSEPGRSAMRRLPSGALCRVGADRTGRDDGIRGYVEAAHRRRRNAINSPSCSATARSPMPSRRWRSRRTSCKDAGTQVFESTMYVSGPKVRMDAPLEKGKDGYAIIDTDEEHHVVRRARARSATSSGPKPTPRRWARRWCSSRR